jgi:uncharacterized protein (TIGR03067 family)
MQRSSCWFALIWFCVSPLASGNEATQAKDDAKKIQGTWKPVTAELAGDSLPDEFVKGMKLVLTDGKYVVTTGEGKDEGTVKLDVAKKPRAMEIMGTKGPNKGKTFLAIYELKDNTLRICYDLSGKAYPKQFKTRANTLLFLVEYKRQKP